MAPRLPQRVRTVILDLRPLQCGYAGKGIGRYTAELGRRLAEGLQASGRGSSGGTAWEGPRYRVESLVFAGRDIPLPHIPVAIFAPERRRMWLWDQAVLPILLLKRRAWLHSFVALGPIDRISFPRLWASRGIATVHDWHMFHEDAPELDRFYRGTRRIALQLKALPRARRVVTDSEPVKVETLMRVGMAADRVAVAPPGGDHLDPVEPEPWNMQNFVLSVGDTPNKDLPFARDVLALLRSRDIHLDWVVVGSRKAVLEQLGCAEGGLPPWITVLESPSDGLLKACFLKALCLLFPSTREGFGIPVLEAMRLGCPVLVSNIEPLRALVDNPAALVRQGMREDWCASVTRFLYSSDLRRAAIESGLRRAAELTWDKCAEAVLKLYGVTRGAGDKIEN